MQIFLSHSTGSEDGPLATRIKAIGAIYETTVILPDREGKLPAKSALHNRMKRADAVVAVITGGDPQNERVKKELEVAKELGKPVLALLDNDLLEGGTRDYLDKLGIPVVGFDRNDPLDHKVNLHKAIESISKSKVSGAKDKDVLVAILAFAILLLSLLILGALVSQPSAKTHAA